MGNCELTRLSARPAEGWTWFLSTCMGANPSTAQEEVSCPSTHLPHSPGLCFFSTTEELAQLVLVSSTMQCRTLPSLEAQPNLLDRPTEGSLGYAEHPGSQETHSAALCFRRSIKAFAPFLQRLGPQGSLLQRKRSSAGPEMEMGGE